jgi:hypothetical protein
MSIEPGITIYRGNVPNISNGTENDNMPSNDAFNLYAIFGQPNNAFSCIVDFQSHEMHHGLIGAS